MRIAHTTCTGLYYLVQGGQPLCSPPPRRAGAMVRTRRAPRLGRGRPVTLLDLSDDGLAAVSEVFKTRVKRRGQGSKRVRNAQLQRLLSRPVSTRFG